MDARSLLACAGLAIALLGATPAAAQEGPGAAERPLSGTFTLSGDLVVGAGETLKVAAGAKIDGAGKLVVHGKLVATGTPSEPILFRVPMTVRDGSDVEVTHARFHDVEGSALDVEGGAVRLRSVAFETNERAIRSLGGAIDVADALFQGSSDAAILAVAPGRLRVSDARFLDSGLALRMYFDGPAPLDVGIESSRFEGNRHHALLAVNGSNGGHRAQFLGNTFGRTTADFTEGFSPMNAAFLVTGDDYTSVDPESAASTRIELSRNDFSTGGTALSLLGGGFALRSTGDSFRGNDVGVQTYFARAEFHGGVFDRNLRYDLRLEGSGDRSRVLLEKTAYSAGKLLIADQNRIEADGVTITAATLVSTAVTGGLLVAFLSLTDAGRGLFARLVLVPLYARLSGPAILSHEKRKQIVDFVAGNPGTHMRRIGNELGLSYGTLTYHVHRLEKEGLLASREEGLFKRFYPIAGRMRSQAEDRPLATGLRAVERAILDDIRRNPGCAQSHIAERLGLSRQALHYQIKKLEKQGLLVKEVHGRETRCFVREGVATDLAADVVTPRSPESSPLLGVAGDAPGER